MKKMNAFEFERNLDKVENLSQQQLKALINRLIDRNMGSVTAFHLTRAVENLDDDQELAGLANELLEQDEKNTEPLFVIYYEDEDDDPADQTLQNRFLSAAQNLVADPSFEKTRMTMSGSRQPITKAPTTRYVKVPSSTRPGHVHTVTLIGGVATKCTCEGYFHRQDCKHLRMV